jgi:hypothetical protein
MSNKSDVPKEVKPRPIETVQNLRDALTQHPREMPVCVGGYKIIGLLRIDGMVDIILGEPISEPKKVPSLKDVLDSVPTVAKKGGDTK